MITVEEAVDVAGSRPRPPAREPQELTAEEEMRLDYVDATIEAGIYKGFDGGMFEFCLPAVYEGAPFGTPALVGALKRLYEAGGWSIAIMPRMVEDRVVEWQFVFAPTARVALPEAKPRAEVALPAVVSLSAAPPPLLGRRLLLRMPTRGRPIQALQVLQKYRELAGAPVAIEVVVDEDDETMLDAAVLERLAALDCVVTVGEHKTKVEACNGGRRRDWDILALISDDMVPVVDGYAKRIVDSYLEHWPHLDGAVYFDDGHQHAMLCTLPILGRRLYEQLGGVYSPRYKSLYCDREQTDVLHARGRLQYVGQKIIEHRHHLWGLAEVDGLYCRNDAYEAEDRATCERRKATRRAHAQSGYDSPPLWLSILICTLPERRAQLEHLLEDLWGQIGRHSDALEIEVLVDDRPGISIGEKRQALLERAKGWFVAHIDDDDGVAHDYVSRVLGALRSQPDADCASLVGAVTTDHGVPLRFEHSVKYEKWGLRDGAHVRCPNHLNAVRRDLALQVGFRAENVGEDHDFSMRLRPLLKEEASTGEAPLYYYWRTTK